MASKTKVTPQKEVMLEKGGPETPPDSPLLDQSDAAINSLIRSAKKRGRQTSATAPQRRENAAGAQAPRR